MNAFSRYQGYLAKSEKDGRSSLFLNDEDSDAKQASFDALVETRQNEIMSNSLKVSLQWLII